MDITFLTEYMSPIIIGLCLVVGWIVKHSFDFIPNKYIPVIVAILGVLISIWIDWGGIAPVTLLTGFVSGLASTGLHQVFKQMLNLSTETET